MKILPFYSRANATIPFRANTSATKSSSSSLGKLIHQTSMFREADTDYFVQRYMMKKFTDRPNVKVVSCACSSGEEVFSYATMLDEFPSNIDYIGFDVDKDIVEQAQKGEVYLSGSGSEAFLTNNELAYTPYLKKCASAFEKHFKPTGKTQLPKLGSDIESLKTLFPEIYKRIVSDFTTTQYKISDEKMKHITFFEGDIKNLENMFEKSSVDVLLFRNAMYHLMCEYNGSDRIQRKDAQEIALDIARQMAQVVKKDGLVVYGSEEKHQGIDTALVNKAMRNNGFEPLIATDDDENEEFLNNLSRYFGKSEIDFHVWKKK